MKKLAIILAFTLCIAGCGETVEIPDTESSPVQEVYGASEETIKVGVLMPLTGTQEEIGAEMRAAVELAFSGIQYQIGNYEVELVYIDSQGDGVKAAQAYEAALKANQFDVGFINWNSSVSLTCMELAAQYQIPHFFAFGADGGINEKYQSDPEYYKYWVGKGWPMAESLVVGYVYAVEEAIEKGLWNPPNRNALILKDDWAWSESLTNAMKTAFSNSDWNIVGEISIQEDFSNFNACLATIEALNPSLIMGTNITTEVTLEFVKRAKQSGVEALFIADGYGQTADWYTLSEGTSDNVLDQSPLFTGVRAESFSKNFYNRYGYYPTPTVGGMSFDWTNYFIKVMQHTLAKYGSITSDTLMQCAQEYVMTGKLTYRSGTVHNEYKFQEDNFPEMVVAAGYYMFPVVQYVQGQTEIIWPYDQKTSNFQMH